MKSLFVPFFAACCIAAASIPLCHAAPSTVPFRTTRLDLRAGASGNSKGASWTASPLGIRRRQQQHGTYPTVQDLDDDEKEATPQDTKDMIDSFLTRDSRNSFISRVYAILSGQLLVTALSIFVFGTNPGLSSWMEQSGLFVPLCSLLISTIAWFIICASPRARREAPMKWQLLAIFTFGEAISVGFISSFYKFQSVLSAMFSTAIATVTISLYTILQRNPKYDLSQWGMGLSSLGMIFLVYGVIHLLELFGVLPQGFLPYTETVYSLVGAALFSCYLAYHTKLIVAGKHAKYQMNDKDYVFGAMSLYNDIINMFIYILRLIGEDREK